jgi:uncharacterized membrane protein
MAKIGHLWAVGYDDVTGADRVCDQITKLAERHCLILLDRAVAVRYPDGTVTLDGEPVMVATIHGRLATFLAGLALGAPPLTSAAVDALTRGADATAAGISEDFVHDVEGLMKPGTSALFVFDDEGDMHAILQAIRGLGGTVLKTNVDPERAKLIQSTLAAKAVDYGPNDTPAHG